MVNTSKILTVSYGTFSCTLEGFDDSFGTMKAIAEYFRDLAADDRYFGAEPPSPDAEMLARIAEREIARRVEAHREDNTFVLRAAGDEAAPQAAPAAPAAALPAAAQAADVATAAPQPATAPTAEAAPEPEAPPAESAEAQQPQSDGQDNTAPEVDESPEVEESTEASGDDTAEIEDLSALIADTEAAAPEDNTPEAAPEPAPQGEPSIDPDSVAAKLQRIRDVVSLTETDAAADPDGYSEDEHANDLLDDEAATEDFLSDTRSDIAAAFAADDAADEELTKDAADHAAEAQVEDEDEDDIGALLDKLSHADEGDEIDLANDAPKAEAPVDEEEDDLVEAPVRARVIKMKKADFEAALSDGLLEEDDEDNAPDAATESSLSPEDEADLMRELAAVEAEFSAEQTEGSAPYALDEDEDNSSIFAEADDTADDEGDDENFFEDEEDDDAFDASLISQTVSGVVRAERSAKLSEAGADEEMGRIFEETNSKLDEDEDRGRRSAIAHLRAAVQATQAERDLGGDLSASGRDTMAYRDDLETAVRPRRPAPHARTPRPEARKPAPLKLVAEQRIDTPKSDEPVRPRRVRASDAPAPVASQADASDFVDYIETVGAHNLAEVLEAAASYMSFVEGVEHFSRPQLMSKLSVTDHASTSREDRLRSFGQLLRAGKIRKLGQGRFEASEDISYRPTSRAAGA